MNDECFGMIVWVVALLGSVGLLGWVLWVLAVFFPR